MKFNKETNNKRRYIYVVIKGIICMIIFVCLLLATSIRWAQEKWSELSMDEIIYHLKAPLNGTGSNMIVEYILKCVVVTIIVFVLLLVICIILKNKRKWRLCVEAAACLAITMWTAAEVATAWSGWNVSDFIGNRNSYSNFIDDNYVYPSQVEISFPEEKRNLIYIYLESMEVTYADTSVEGAFKDNYIPRLTEISQNAENFSGDKNTLNGGYVMSNTTWTMGAMYGQSVGLPLSIPIDGSEMDTQDSFFPGVTSIGDILNEAGYQNALLIGSKAVFGGRELFYEEHGDYEIWDYTYSKESGEIPEDYYVWWGYEDEKLFDNAKKHLQELGSQEQPFNLTILTADTHFEDGYYCEDCPDTYGDDQYANVIACSDKKVTEFVTWIQEQDFYENTTVVLVGDHPTMDNDFCDSVDENYVRKVYTTFLNAPLEPEVDKYREYSTFDMFPTTLAALGVKIEGERLGLGTNLFSQVSTLTEEYGREVENKEILKRSILIDELNRSIDQNPTKLSEQEKMVEEQIKLLEEQENAAKASVTIQPYDYRKGYFEINVEVTDPLDSIQLIKCAVWSEEDQSDFRWYEADLKDGIYTVNVYARDYYFKTGIYQIHVYGVDKNGESRALVCTTGEITS